MNTITKRSVMEGLCCHLEGNSYPCQKMQKDKRSMYCKAHQQESSVSAIKAYIGEGREVYTMVSSVSKSGMSRRIRVYAPYLEGDAPKIVDLTGHVANVLDRSGDIDSGVLVRGCGMDFGHSLVDDLSHAFGINLVHRSL